MTSYMLPRLVFRGQFLAAPSTPNNWSKTFQDTPKDWTQNTDQNGEPTGINNWNPFGGADVRFPTSRLVDAVTKPGVPWDRAGPRLVIDTDYERSVAKICDQDPMMQMMSRIFGLHLTIKNADTGAVYLKGRMHHTAFTDITGGTYGPRARYTSAVKFTQVTAPEDGNAALTALYELAADPSQTLGLTMMVGAHFHSDQSLEWANIGTGTFAIGPFADQLHGFDNHQEVFQRRILPSPIPQKLKLNTTYMACQGQVLTVDMANTFDMRSRQITPKSAKQTGPDTRFRETSGVPKKQIGKVTIAALQSDADIHFDATKITFTQSNKAQILTPGMTIHETQFTQLGVIDFSPTASDADSLLETTGLLFDFSLTAGQAAAAKSQPLAILQETDDGFVIISRETLAGINIAYTGGRAIATVGLEVNHDIAKTRISVRQYDKILDPANYAAQLSVAPAHIAYTANDQTAFSEAGGKMGWPENALAPTLSDDVLAFHVVKGITAPRQASSKGYTDIRGQIYQFNVEPNVSDEVMKIAGDFIQQMTAQEQGQMDFISVLALDTGKTKPNPDFETDVKPIMQQYANLYPVMSRYLFNLADEAQLQKNATILYFAFTASQASGHYMPVTRDMPQWQRQTICNWLKTFMSPEQIGRMEARAMAEVIPELTSDRAENDTSKVLHQLAEHVGATSTEIADLLVQMDVPVNADLDQIFEQNSEDLLPGLLALHQRANRRMRGAPDAHEDPKPIPIIPSRRANIADAVKETFGPIDAGYAKEFSKAGVIANLINSNT